MTVDGLLDWYRRRARQLPWRREPRDPYHVVVSEFMLQQTRVDRVAPRFEAFVARFPNFRTLAGSAEDDVVAAWSGLGYYRRARLLHRLAAEVEARGGLPRTASELERLPGIGPYTAAAVASLAFGERVPVLDGNVLRVGSRWLALEEDPRSASGARRLRQWVLEVMGERPPDVVNEALMELGATVCTPSSPDCEACPIASGCRARAEGRPARYPAPRSRRAAVSLRWVAALCRDRGGRLLVRRIEDGPILHGLWLPPIAELVDGDDPRSIARGLVPALAMTDGRIAGTVRHTITHRKIDVLPVVFVVDTGNPQGSGWQWIDPRDPGVATSSLLHKLVAASDRER